MLRALVSPLHVHTTRLPNILQAIIAPIQSSHLRLLERDTGSDPQALEAAVRPALLPNEAWSDTERWRGNLRLLAWLRDAHFRALPSTQRLLPEARAALSARLQSRSMGPPSMEEARRLLGLSHPTGAPRSACLHRAQARAAAAGGTDGAAVPPPPPMGSTVGIPLAEVLEASGGLVA